MLRITDDMTKTEFLVLLLRQPETIENLNHAGKVARMTALRWQDERRALLTRQSWGDRGRSLA